MTKGRVVLTSTAVIGDGQSRRLSAIFISLGGPEAHDSSGREYKFFAGNGLKSGRMNRESEGESSGIPHLAKKERDVGHPSP